MVVLEMIGTFALSLVLMAAFVVGGLALATMMGLFRPE